MVTLTQQKKPRPDEGAGLFLGDRAAAVVGLIRADITAHASSAPGFVLMLVTGRIHVSHP
jgi:hypothetical protein